MGDLILSDVNQLRLKVCLEEYFNDWTHLKADDGVYLYRPCQFMWFLQYPLSTSNPWYVYKVHNEVSRTLLVELPDLDSSVLSVLDLLRCATDLKEHLDVYFKSKCLIFKTGEYVPCLHPLRMFVNSSDGRQVTFQDGTDVMYSPLPEGRIWIKITQASDITYAYTLNNLDDFENWKRRFFP